MYDLGLVQEKYELASRLHSDNITAEPVPSTLNDMITSDLSEEPPSVIVSPSPFCADVMIVIGFYQL